MRQHGRQRVEHGVDLAAEQVVVGGRAALVRDVRNVGAGALLEHLEGQVLERADATRAVAQFAGRGFGGGQQLLQGLVFRIGAHHQRLGHAGHVHDRRQFARVVAGVAVQVGCRCQRAAGPEQQGVAVRRRSGRGAAAHRAAGAAPVVHDQRLAPDARQLLAQHPRQHVAALAGGEGHDDGHRLGGVAGRALLRPAERGCQCGQRHSGQRLDQGSALHGCFLSGEAPIVGLYRHLICRDIYDEHMRNILRARP